jgi:hypothetical protein
MRVEGVDGQVGTIFRRVELPDDWREKLAEMVEQDEERKTLNDQHARLVVELTALCKDRWGKSDVSV